MLAASVLRKSTPAQEQKHACVGMISEAGVIVPMKSQKKDGARFQLRKMSVQGIEDQDWSNVYLKLSDAKKELQIEVPSPGKNDQQHAHKENVDKIEQRTRPRLEMVRVLEQNLAKAVGIVLYSR